MNALFILLGSFFFTALSSSADPVEILYIGPMTGDVAILGVSAANGLRIAEKELKTDGIRIRYEDDQFKPVNAVTIYQRAKSSVPPDVVFVAGSQSSLALVPLTEKDGVALIAIASDGSISKDKKYAVNLWVTPKAEMEAVVREMKRNNLSRAHVLVAEHQGALAVIAPLRQSEIEIISEQRLPTDMADCRTVAANIKKLGTSDPVIMILFPGQLSNCARNLRDIGVTGQFIGAETMESEADIISAKGALEGAWFAQAPIPSEELSRSLQKEFGNSPTVGAPSGYDSYLLVKKAYEEGHRDGRSIGEYLRKIGTVEGKQGRFAAAGDGTFTIPAVIKRIEGSRFIVVE